jgi:hypothetical protein
MSLGKLLAAGKSVISGKGVIPYRENKRVYLPKFNPQKNPFIAPPQTESPPPAEKTVSAAKTQKMPALPTLRIKSLAQNKGTTWADRLNPMALLRGPATDATQPVFQAELSLDSVKVVHNDLTDAEVEVVPVKSRSAPDLAIPDLRPARQSWEVLGERLFGVRMT